MCVLTIRFMWTLLNQDVKHHHHISGPLFTHWLPDGEKDKISIPTDDREVQLHVWTERRGHADHGMIKYDYARKEVDENLIPKQAWLDGGYIFGALTLNNIAAGTIDVIKAKMTNDPLYEAIGRRVIKAFVPAFARFLDILRTVYGQYWLAPMIEWDSRVFTIGAYCSMLHMRWRTEEDEEWGKFLPTDKLTTISWAGSTGGFGQYLTKADWTELEALCANRFEPTIALRLLANAHALLDQDHLKFAILEGCSALDVAVNELIRQKRKPFSKDIGDAVAPFLKQEKLPMQVSVLAVLSGKIKPNDLDACLRIINRRNKIVHDGEETQSTDAKDLRGLMQVVIGLISDVIPKFPRHNNGNIIGPEVDSSQFA